MHVLVTGGAGYIGTEVVKKLAEQSKITSVTVYDNLSRHNYNLFLQCEGLNRKLRFVHGDILDSRKLKNCLNAIDIVIHLAAKVTTPFSHLDSHMYEQVNNWGTAELTYAVEKSDVKQLIFMSSTSVYGSRPLPFCEADEPNPNGYYAISKYRAEAHINRLSDKIRTHIIRCGNVYGYGNSIRFDAVVNKMLFDAKFSKAVSIHGSGDQFRSFIHVSVVAQVINQLILLQNNPQSGTYNLATDNLCINDIVNVLSALKPELEHIRINKHVKMIGQQIVLPCKLLEYLPFSYHSFERNLADLYLKFA